MSFHRARIAAPTWVALSLAASLLSCSRHDDSIVDGGDVDAADTGHDAGPCCLDTDGDTICDIDEGSADVDHDGVPNFRDNDSDGDTVSDRVEAGRMETCMIPADHDSDGLPDYLDPNFPNFDGGMDAGL